MSLRRPNIILITSDQQRADCNGFDQLDFFLGKQEKSNREGFVF